MVGMWKGMRRFDKEGIGGGRIAQRMLAGMPGVMVGMRKGVGRSERERMGGWRIPQGDVGGDAEGDEQI